MEEEIRLVDEAHVGRLFPCGKHLPTNVKRPHLHVFASFVCIRLALVVRHHLIFGRPHAQVVDHLETKQPAWCEEAEDMTAVLIDF